LGIKVNNRILVLLIIFSAAIWVIITGGGSSSSIIKSSFSISTSQSQPPSAIQPHQQNNTTIQSGNNNNNRTTIVFRVAFVRPTFTYAAYQLNGFYNFYSKYIDPQPGTNITTDLNLLTVKVPQGLFLLHNQKPGDKPGIKEQDDYFKTLIAHVESKAPNPIKISNITDKEVNDGLIFNHTKDTGSSNNDTNAYDVLFLFHQEYATQAEYNNLKQFVENGGTIVFNDGNILTTEVRYVGSNDTVTLVRGHNWQYNGKTAWRTGEPERWFNETWKWVGSSFLNVPASPKVNATFSNDHFGYKHIEEQYVTNPKDKMILDFGTLVYENPTEKYAKYASARVAVYELDSGNNNNGRVIMLSIFAHTLVLNTDFLDFYDSKVVPLAFAY
jgi:hypothetical protein